MKRTDIDERDLQIIDQLQRDGRRPFTAIARDLGMSEAAVRKRAERLIRRKALRIIGVIDPMELGFGVMAAITIKVKGEPLEEVARRLAELPEIDYVALCAGSSDLLVEVVCRDHQHLLRLISENIAPIRGVASHDTLVYLKTAKWVVPFPYHGDAAID